MSRRACVETYRYAVERDTHPDLPLCAHTLATSHAHADTSRGDTYTSEVAATVWAVMQELGFSNP